VLARAARLVRDADQYANYALAGERPQVDFPRLLERTQELVYRVHEKKQLSSHLQEAGVKVLANAGDARFTDPHTVAMANAGLGQVIRGDKFIICAGGHARRLPFPGSEYALTHSDVWSLDRLPGSVAIVGGAATGCQLASVFAAFGAQVRLIDVAPSLLGAEDELVAQGIESAFRRRGIEVTTGASGVERIEREGETLRLSYGVAGRTEALDVEAVVLAVGWPGNVEALNLPAAGVETARGYITVDDTLRTSAPHIFAAGDITGRMMLVQSATGEGAVAAENCVLGAGRNYLHRIVPHGGFTDPEYGSVGLTESQARSQNDCAVAVVPYAGLDRAVIDGHTEGFCKLIVSMDSRQVLGAHVVGEQGVEIVQIVAAAMSAGMRVEQLAELELSYPTFTAIVGLAARQLLRELDQRPSPPVAWSEGPEGPEPAKEGRRPEIGRGTSEWERSEA
jgi:pyruvate/2-oxoglutarate dehydrogenase complex dihydrolipoamide dehydrogenase (E3) component